MLSFLNQIAKYNSSSFTTIICFLYAKIKAIPKNTKGIKHIATPIFPVTNVTSTIIKKKTVVTILNFLQIYLI